VVRSGRFCALRDIGSHSQGSLFAGLAPAALLHDDTNHHADRLSQALRATRVLGREKPVYRRLSLELSNNPRQRRPVVVNLGVFHSPLSLGIAEKGEHVIERLLRILQHIGERSSLPIFAKSLSGNTDGTRHR
jgi:hypothetical protein